MAEALKQRGIPGSVLKKHGIAERLVDVLRSEAANPGAVKSCLQLH
jgi:hypothetical protein